jgi:hypothetical protein
MEKVFSVFGLIKVDFLMFVGAIKIRAFVMALGRAVEREVEPVIFTGARDSKGAQKSEIDFILGHILVFLGPEKCGISTNLGPALKSIYMNLGPRKDKKFS